MSASAFLVSFIGFAQTPGGSEGIPLDPDVTTGVLSNGIKYYIKKNVEPANRMELRLAVNAGSMQENDNQQGLAHFCEHMAFNGTKNFKKQEIVDYLESIGTQFGAHLNAYTSFDETVYMLQAPTDDQDIMDKAFLILSDWAGGVTFENEEVEKERGVVIEEWRLGQGANERLRKEWWPVAFKDSRYANRLPIGKKDILETFDPELIRQFYRDWYRPDLMAVVAVGDFDVKKVEALIKQKFSGIEANDRVREKASNAVPAQKGLRVAVAKDKEARFAQVRVSHMLPSFTPKTLDEYRTQIMSTLIQIMMSGRLSEMTTKPDASFNYGFANYGSQVRTRDQFTVMGITSANKLEACVKDLLLECKRVSQHGFTPGEVERAKAQFMSYVESQMKEKDKTASRQVVMEYVYHFLSNQPVPGTAFDYEFANTHLPAISIEELNALAQGWIASDDRMIIVTGPDMEGVEYPEEIAITNLDQVVSGLEVEAYEDQTNNEPLVAELPSIGSVKDEDKVESMGAVQWTLSNGAKVLYKKTDFKNDEVLFAAESKGGYSLYEGNTLWSARSADRIVDESGLGAFDQTQLSKKLAGQDVSLYPYIGLYEEGFRGNTSPDDIETFFQLLHLYFTNPRKDEEAFQVYKKRSLTFLDNQSKNPSSAFRTKLNATLTQNSPYTATRTPKAMDQVQLDKGYKVFKERFSSPSDFTFYFVGNVNEAQLKELCNKYIGSIPAGVTNEKHKDVGIRSPKGVVKETVKKGVEPQSTVALVFTGKFKGSKFHSLAPKALEKALGIKLRQALREDEGGTYGVTCRLQTSDVPVSEYKIMISFGCAPENVDKLVKAAFKEINDMKEAGPTDEDIVKYKESAKRGFEAKQQRNRYWLEQLSNYAQEGKEASTPEEYQKNLDDLTAKDIQKAAKKLLNEKNYVKVVLKPEN